MPKKEKDPIIAAAYYRFSSHKQNEQSIEGQRHDCEHYAEQNGIKIVKEYIDRALTGTSDSRPAFKELINDSASGRFNAVLVWKLDRFARNRYDSAHYKARLKKNGVKVISATEPIPDTPEGILLESLLEGMAEYYSADLAQKLKRGMRESARKCKALGPIPLGYKKGKDGLFEIDEKTAPTIRLIYKLFADGYGNAEIVRTLNTKGLRTAKGTLFKTNSIYNILQNIRYTGLYKFEDIEIPGGMPAIIDSELYWKVQKMKNEHRTSFRRKLDSRDYTLTPKLFCGHCNTMMTGMSCYNRANDKYYYYHCKNHKPGSDCPIKNVRAEVLEDAVYDALKNIVLDDGMISNIAERIYAMNKAQRDNTALDALTAQLNTAQSEADNLMKAIKSGVTSKLISDELSRLEDHITDLNYSIIAEKAKAPDITQEQIEFMLYKLRNECRNAEHAEKLIDTFVNKIYYTGDRLIIWLNYTKKPVGTDMPEVEKIIIDAIKENREQGSSVLCYGGPSRTRT